mgnify:CR=1 FL=1
MLSLDFRTDRYDLQRRNEMKDKKGEIQWIERRNRNEMNNKKWSDIQKKYKITELENWKIQTKLQTWEKQWVAQYDKELHYQNTVEESSRWLNTVIMGTVAIIIIF